VKTWSFRALAAVLLTLGAISLAPSRARAHELDSASLSLQEVTPGRFALRFHANSEALGAQLQAPAVFPAACRLYEGALDCGSSGLVGTIEFPWLEGTLTRVLIDIEWLSGERLLRVASPSARSITVYGIPRSAGLAALRPIIFDYVRLGIEHILTGFDHLMFVVAFTLLVRGRAQLLATITAFTLAHSLSLAATVLDLVHLPAPPVEATIALSIVLVCVECLRPQGSLTQRAPWLVAFIFGLLHGLGFASALLAIGLPEQHIPTSLLCFNLGVELGQLSVVALAVGLKLLVARLKLEPARFARPVVYAMGSVAAYWSIERIQGLF
jgi:hydrogenase/urease accessory protein HupE